MKKRSSIIQDLRPQVAYCLQMADNALILGHRLSEWCGHGPVLEQDIALTNLALDHIGQARYIYQYAAELQGDGMTEDDWAYTRDVRAFRNILLVEQPNGDFAHTIVRQFFFDAFNLLFQDALTHSTDERLAAIASKSLKEVQYHYRFSSEWMKRLGDGTEESHHRMQRALADLWMYKDEAFEMSEADAAMLDAGIGVDLPALKTEFDQRVHTILKASTLEPIEEPWQQSGGKNGRHSEHLGYILADMQYLQRAYPGLEW